MPLTCNPTAPSRRWPAILLCVIVLALAGCGSAPKSYPSGSPASARGHTESGMASYYGDEFHGRKTANGERFDQNKLTAAHKQLPFGTRVRVVNRQNGKSVVVRVNDRGPFVKGRIIDLSSSAFRSIASIRAGVVPVHIEVVN